MSHIDAIIELQDALFTPNPNQNMVEIIYESFEKGLNIEEIYSLIVKSMHNKVPVNYDNLHALIEASSKRKNAAFLLTSIQYCVKKDMLKDDSSLIPVDVVVDIYILRDLFDHGLTDINFVFDLAKNFITNPSTTSFLPQIFVFLILFSEELYQLDNIWYSNQILHLNKPTQLLRFFLHYERRTMQFHNIMKPMIQLFMDCKDDFFKECVSLRETCYMRGMAEGAIVVDDIDKLVELSTKPNYVESTKIVRISPFLPIKFKNKTDITMLEFATACYSNKCFKFLYLKNVDDIENEHLHLLECAVKANNFEVIRIIYQSVFISNKCLWDISILQLALKCNRNDLLLWIYNNLTNNRP